MMMQYRWPGNIRELAAVVDRAVILGEGQHLDIATALGAGTAAAQPASSPKSIPDNEPTFYEVVPESAPRVPSSQPHQVTADFEPSTLDEAMKRHIEKTLGRVGGRIEGRGGAAEQLGINPHTLRARMRKLGVQWSSFRTQA
jgi:hydrogenase-4 transcriptional activator